MVWKKERGKLGVLAPLLGTWMAQADSPMGVVMCTRAFTKVLGGKYVQLKAIWQIGERLHPGTSEGSYGEIALFGIADGVLTCWSFTSDGKRSLGVISPAPDIHAEAICFEAEMPAGMARQIYWPSGQGMSWAVESRNKKGWHRFTEHQYTPMG